jgi:hypothetical protein
MSTSPLMHAVSVVPTSTVRHGIPKSNNWVLTQTAITGGWGETPLPLCVGHEIIGTLHKDHICLVPSITHLRNECIARHMR